MGPYRDAIAAIESRGSGDYNAVNKTSGAVGRYQVMPQYVPQWTKEALGKSMTPDQFKASPEAQDRVFDKRFGGYMSRTGNPNDAASMWRTGQPLARGGTTGAGYAKRFGENLKQGGMGNISGSMSDFGGPAQPTAKTRDLRRGMEPGSSPPFSPLHAEPPPAIQYRKLQEQPGGIQPTTPTDSLPSKPREYAQVGGGFHEISGGMSDFQSKTAPDAQHFLHGIKAAEGVPYSGHSSTGAIGAYGLTGGFIKQWAPGAGLPTDRGSYVGNVGLQDKLATHAATQMYGQYGSWDKVANAWLTGSPTATVSAPGNMTPKAYTAKVMANTGAQPGGSTPTSRPGVSTPATQPGGSTTHPSNGLDKAIASTERQLGELDEGKSAKAVGKSPQAPGDSGSKTREPDAPQGGDEALGALGQQVAAGGQAASQGLAQSAGQEYERASHLLDAPQIQSAEQLAGLKPGQVFRDPSGKLRYYTPEAQRPQQGQG